MQNGLCYNCALMYIPYNNYKYRIYILYEANAWEDRPESEFDRARRSEFCNFFAI